LLIFGEINLSVHAVDDRSKGSGGLGSNLRHRIPSVMATILSRTSLPGVYAAGDETKNLRRAGAGGRLRGGQSGLKRLRSLAAAH